MRKYITFLLIGFLVLTFSSCKLMYPNIMFKQKDYQIFEIKDRLISNYVVKPNDMITVQVYSRDGFDLIDKTANSNSTVKTNISTNLNQSNIAEYRVDDKGFADLPILGNYYVEGLTEIALKANLENEYSKLYVDPFVNVRVVNRRVFVFKGAVGQVIPLNPTPTTLIEVLALSGGLTQGLKSYNIKVIRGDLKNPNILQVDLSSIEGLTQSEIVLQSNDIVYVEPRRKIFTDALREVTTTISILTSILTSGVLIYTLTKK